MADDRVRIVPLGGLGEVGMNCLAIEEEGGILVVDCGIGFPHDDLGVDTVHPSFAWLEARKDRVRGVFLTHGHEDHVGALGYLLERIQVPVYGPPHALAVARHRLRERSRDAERAHLVTTSPRERYDVGPFEVEPIRVTHSITDATALAIRSRAGTIVHTGDFKLDPTPPDGEVTDEARFVELGDAGVRLLLSDSTNIDARGTPASELTVGDALGRIVRQADARVVIGTFASNVQRLRLIGEIAIRSRRKIALFGRSLQSHVEWAHDIGRLDWPSDLLIPTDEAKSFPKKKLLVLASGTQAEPLAAMTRLAARTHPALALDPGDTVVFSSRIIPGNDLGVFHVMSNLLRQGVVVRNWMTDPDVHVSGHAMRSEQRRMLEMVRPRSFIPVHGTLHHLMRHAELAREVGVADVRVIENGDVAVLSEQGLEKGERVESGRVATYAGREIPAAVLRDREALARAGAVHVVVVVDERGRLREPPVVVTRGVVSESAQPSAHKAAALEIAKAFEGRPWRVERPDDELVGDVARAAARRSLESLVGRKPVATATVVRT